MHVVKHNWLTWLGPSPIFKHIPTKMPVPIWLKCFSRNSNTLNSNTTGVLPRLRKRGVAPGSKNSTDSEKFQRVGGSAQHINIHIHTYTYLYIYIYIYTHIHTYTTMYMCIHIEQHQKYICQTSKKSYRHTMNKH